MWDIISNTFTVFFDFLIITKIIGVLCVCYILALLVNGRLPKNNKEST